jgi:hypothetical protein
MADQYPQTDVVVIGSSGDDRNLKLRSGTCDDPIVISDDDDDDDRELSANPIVIDIDIDMSESDTELPSAKSIIKRIPSTPVARETAAPATPHCSVKPETEAPPREQITPILLKLKRTLDASDQSPGKCKLSPLKKFKLIVPKVDKNVYTPLTQDKTLQLYPPARYFICPSIEACLFTNHMLDYIDSVSDTSLSEFVERFVSYQYTPPIHFIVSLLKSLIDSKTPHTTLSLYFLLRQCITLSTPRLQQQEVHDVLDHIVTNMGQQLGSSLAMSLLISIIDWLQRCKVGKPIFHHSGRWNTELCRWLMPSLTRPVIIEPKLELCLPLLTHLQQLVTLYCLHTQNISVKEKLATSWVDIYKASTHSQRQSLLQNMGDHEMRALLIDKLLAVQFPRTSSVTDGIVWSNQSPSIAKTVHLHFYRQPGSDVSDFLMLLGYLLQSCFISRLSAEYNVVIDTKTLKEGKRLMTDRLVGSCKEEDMLFINLAIELADILHVID